MIVNGGSANERLVLELTRNPNFGNTLRNDRSRKKTHMNSNLSFNTTEDAIRQAFGAHGDITDIYVAMDRETGRPRGFAFVTFSKAEEAQAAIEALNGSDLDGRSLKVNEAKPRE